MQNTKSIDFSFNPHYEESFKFYDQSLLDTIQNKEVTCYEFFRLLAVCHTVMPEDKNGIQPINSLNQLLLFGHSNPAIFQLVEDGS